jgi:LacI family transcriptional regulator, galactose operon repressor
MNGKRYRPSTIVEVARLAGVSPSTVSRVLNGTAAVAPETEQRVREAIAELNFSPHPAARQLVSQRTNTIGLLLPEISGEFFPPMLRGIEAGVRQAGYDLLIHSTQESHIHSHRPLREHNTDGLIVFPGSVDDQELRRLFGMGFPVVLLYKSAPEGANYPFVTVENKSGAEKAITHLIEVHGRRRIVFLQGPEGHEDSIWRERGYRQALQVHGLTFDPELVGYGGFDDQVSFQTIQRWMREGLAFDAAFAGDDEAATGVIAALLQAGRRVPEDVSVVGFDDVPFSRYVSPPLTTVRAPSEQVGREAVRLLVKCIQEEPCEPEILLPTELVIRQSCGCRVAPVGLN